MNLVEALPDVYHAMPPGRSPLLPFTFPISPSGPPAGRRRSHPSWPSQAHPLPDNVELYGPSLSSPFALVGELVLELITSPYPHSLHPIEDDERSWSMLVDGLTRMVITALKTRHLAQEEGRPLICELLLLLNVSVPAGVARQPSLKDKKNAHAPASRASVLDGRIADVCRDAHGELNISLDNAAFRSAVALAIRLRRWDSVEQLLELITMEWEGPGGMFNDLGAHTVTRKALVDWAIAVRERMREDGLGSEIEGIDGPFDDASGAAAKGLSLREAMARISTTPRAQSSRLGWKKDLLESVITGAAESGSVRQLETAARRMRRKVIAVLGPGKRGEVQLLDHLGRMLRDGTPSLAAFERASAIDHARRAEEQQLAPDAKTLRWMRDTAAIQRGNYSEMMFGYSANAIASSPFHHRAAYSQLAARAEPLAQEEQSEPPQRTAFAVQRAKAKRRTRAWRCATAALQIRRWTIAETDFAPAEKLLADLFSQGIPITYTHVEPFVYALCSAGRVEDALRVKREAQSQLGLAPSRKMQASLIAAMIVSNDVGGAIRLADEVHEASPVIGWADVMKRIDALVALWRNSSRDELYTAEQEQLLSHLHTCAGLSRDELLKNRSMTKQRLTLLSKAGYPLEAQRSLASALDAGLKSDADVSWASQRAGMRIRRAARDLVVTHPHLIPQISNEEGEESDSARGLREPKRTSRSRRAEEVGRGGRGDDLMQAYKLHLENRQRLEAQNPSRIAREAKTVAGSDTAYLRSLTEARKEAIQGRAFRRSILDLVAQLAKLSSPPATPH